MRDVVTAVAATAAFGIALAGPSQAQDVEAPWFHVGWSVYTHATGFADGILTTEQELDMGLIAFQSAAARVCTDYAIDQPKLAAAVDGLEHVNADDLSEDEAAYTERLRAIVIGMVIGGFIAEFTVDPDAFCGSVEDFVASEGDEALITRR